MRACPSRCCGTHCRASHYVYVCVKALWQRGLRRGQRRRRPDRSDTAAREDVPRVPAEPAPVLSAVRSLRHALQRLLSSSVQLSGDIRPGVSAYADDLKIFSSIKTGVTAQHELVATFLDWTRMKATPTKCRSMGVRRKRQRCGRGG
ncbi:hypothetical protein PR003_g9187 [Phytophthora rubi]|uniref:Reverse transcriptase domain-containing protein n=1 Tax=Phytophthora rubi TaxID=129364 RepID=A0A6A4FHE6_9STRA|nr:hypothetical protein PR003_g9187 [Phytophthora rubi]